MEEEQKKYQIEYSNFIKDYKSGQLSGENIGEILGRMVQYYCDQNIFLVATNERYNKIAAINVDKLDEGTGKLISVSKADILTNASNEYNEYNKAKAHLQNLEQIINALKTIQKGILNEYSHVGNI